MGILARLLALPAVKAGAFDGDVLARLPALRPGPGGEREAVPGPAWMNGVDPSRHATFAGYRTPSGELRYCRVLACDPAADRLALQPLSVSPVEVLADPARAGDAAGEPFDVSLDEAVARRLLGPPLPTPRRIFAVAANYASHMVHDLAVDRVTLARARDRLPTARARVFVKYPPVPAPGGGEGPEAVRGVIGPFDPIRGPERVAIPEHDGRVPTHLDYEAEVGAVIGRPLSDAGASDAELRAAVVGYVLVSDAKARNPQVMGKVLLLGRPAPPPNTYSVADAEIRAILPPWNRATCRWWSHAASWGDYAALGPFLVGAPLGTRGLASARSYAAGRSLARPRRLAGDALYLRQCSVATEDRAHADALLWNVPAILRSILSADSALDFDEGAARLEPGDVVCLGTPGGAVITSKSRRRLRLLNTLLFWMSAKEKHDLAFRGKEGYYLQPGDGLFLWGEGLGYQLHRVERLG